MYVANSWLVASSLKTWRRVNCIQAINNETVEIRKSNINKWIVIWISCVVDINWDKN